MSIIKNKEVLQSYILTTAKYDFSIYEKRILYRIIEVLQAEISGLKLNYNYSLQKNLLDEMEFVLPINIFLKDDEDDNYREVKKALRSLRNKDFEYEDAKSWGVYGIIESPVIEKYNSFIKFKITPLLLEAFLNFAKGFRKYELKTAMEFNSIYTMRFYELLSGQERPLTFTIDQLKAMFKLENKYKETKDFIKYVIDPAKKELYKKSPYSFDFKINKQGKKFHSITFYPVKIQENQDPELEKQKVLKEVSLHWSLDRATINYLKEVFFFDTKELKQHQELFENAHKLMDLILFLSERKRYILEAKNPKGYLISCLKKEVERLSNEFFNTDFQPPENASQESKKLFKEVSKLKNKMKIE